MDLLFRYMTCVLSAGLYYRFSGGKQRTTKEYLMADGQMAVLPVAFSLMASFMSAITLLGVSQVLGSMLLRASAQKQRAIPATCTAALYHIVPKIWHIPRV
jgi:Na+/proline symporter